MFIELTRMRPRSKITVAASAITGLKKSTTQRGSLIQMTNGTSIEVFEFYRVVQWLLYRARRVAIAQFSLERDKLEWQSWCSEYMGDQRNEWQDTFDDRNYTHPNDVDNREISHMDDQGCVYYEDGTKGWIYSYVVVDVDEAGKRTNRREITGLNHKLMVKIDDFGNPIRTSEASELHTEWARASKTLQDD